MRTILLMSAVALAAGFCRAEGTIGPLPERVKGLACERTSWRSVGPGGGGWIQSMLWSRHARDRFFVGCDVGGFYCSEDGGRHYEMRNRGLRHYFIQTIAEHPVNPDILFLGSQGGIYKTTDRGLNWREKRTGLPPVSGGSHSVQISKFAFRPDNPDVIYAAVGQPRTRRGARGEVWRSDDCGETWKMIVTAGLAKDVDIYDLSLDSQNGDRMLISSNRGLFRSEDGGATWTASNEGLPSHLRTRFLARCAARPEVVYVTLRQKAGEEPWSAGVYRSDDGGRTWVERSGGLRRVAGKSGCGDELSCWTDTVAVDPKDPDKVWTGGATWWYTGVYMTRDGGRNWKSAFPEKKPGWITFWGPSAACMSLSPLDGGRLSFGTSGMVFTTEDDAATWSQRYSEERSDGRIGSTGLEVTCLHSVTASRHRKGRFYLGYFDIGLLVTDDDGRTMTRQMKAVPDRFSNSCFSVAEAPDDPETVFACFGGWSGGGSGCIARSDDGCRNWTLCTNAASGWVDAATADIVVLGSKPNYRVLAAGGKGLVLSMDGGATWKRPSADEFPESARVRALTRSGDNLYAAVQGTDDDPSAVFVRRRGDRAWRRLTTRAENIGTVQRVAAEGDRIVVTARDEWRRATGQTRRGGVWLSTDAGATWKLAFADRFAAAALVLDGEIYASITDHPYHDHCEGGGVIHTKDDGKTWTYLDGPGLQNWNVTSIAVDPFDRKTLWLGTGGNSVFVLEGR